MKFPFGRPALSLVLALAVATPSYAWAAPGKEPTTEEMAEARRRYDRALELTDEGNYDEALVELQRAYAVAPTYRLLYNLGVVSVAVHDYVKAIDYFNRYLIQGGTEVEPARATEVQKQVERLRARIATVRVTVNVPGADVEIDDISVGKAPLDKPIIVNPGRHRVSSSLGGYYPAATVVELASSDNRSISLTLTQQTTAEGKPSRPLPWTAYGVTAALGVGATVTGILALTSKSSYEDKVGTLGVSGDDVASSYRTMRALSVMCDVLLVGTIVAAGVSAYLTLRPPHKSKTGGLQLTPSGFVF